MQTLIIFTESRLYVMFKIVYLESGMKLLLLFILANAARVSYNSH
jgi:hypothetical protein